MMSACMPHARLAGDGMPEGSSQKSSTGVPFAVVSRKNCSSRFSHLMRQAINTVIRRNRAQSSLISRNQWSPSAHALGTKGSSGNQA